MIVRKTHRTQHIVVFMAISYTVKGTKQSATKVPLVKARTKIKFLCSSLGTVSDFFQEVVRALAKLKSCQSRTNLATMSS